MTGLDDIGAAARQDQQLRDEIKAVVLDTLETFLEYAAQVEDTVPANLHGHCTKPVALLKTALGELRTARRPIGDCRGEAEGGGDSQCDHPTPDEGECEHEWHVGEVWFAVDGTLHVPEECTACDHKRQRAFRPVNLLSHERHAQRIEETEGGGDIWDGTFLINDLDYAASVDELVRLAELAAHHLDRLYDPTKVSAEDRTNWMQLKQMTVRLKEWKDKPIPTALVKELVEAVDRALVEAKVIRCGDCADEIEEHLDALRPHLKDAPTPDPRKAATDAACQEAERLLVVPHLRHKGIEKAARRYVRLCLQTVQPVPLTLEQDNAFADLIAALGGES